jgi:hypothetical protein
MERRVMKKPRKAPSRPAIAKTDTGEGQGSGKPELRQSEARTPEGTFAPGVSGNPGGISKEKRAFLERLKADDAQTIYDAFMQGVRDGVPPIIIRAVEYLAGKPKESVELSGEVKAAIEHDIKAEVVQSPQRIARIVRVLEESGALALAKLEAETAEPVETKEKT